MITDGYVNLDLYFCFIATTHVLLIWFFFLKGLMLIYSSNKKLRLIFWFSKIFNRAIKRNP